MVPWDPLLQVQLHLRIRKPKNAVIEQTLYSGKQAWRRRSFGSIRRLDLTSSAGYLSVTSEERADNGRKSHAYAHRDPLQWLMVDTIVRCEPIVAFGVWQADMRRLATMGATNQ